ncbi:hypothetical protein ElyMa_001901200 [Elysia marginata]|uniref:Uncharacterized protein n=1 Tax=Elysia marginata TaxID=1093978 RepID=A0AAV4ET53_9GAST|nr:hypothetical protein ElyMa_001901200 [Elysia marginata]
MSRRKQSRPRHVEEGVAGDSFTSSAHDEHEDRLTTLEHAEDGHVAVVSLKRRPVEPSGDTNSSDAGLEDQNEEARPGISDSLTGSTGK